ncbi:MAG: thioredoxin family protein [Proteobacteria bacterium]|nr:thioredoxin family protein [Pseudomonadota bacterium]
MKNWLILFISVFCVTAHAIEELKNIEIDSLPDYSKAYDPERDPFVDGNNALKNAKETRRRVVIEVGGDWCSWCHVLDEFINTTPAIYEQLYNNFVVLKVNYSDANENELFLGGLPKITGYPHWYITDNDGSIVYSGNIVHLLEDGKYSPTLFSRFLNKWSL